MLRKLTDAEALGLICVIYANDCSKRQNLVITQSTSKICEMQNHKCGASLNPEIHSLSSFLCGFYSLYFWYINCLFLVH